MAPSEDAQLEKVIDDVLKNGNIQALDSFLQRDTQDGIPIKCSQQFLTRLDKLVSRSLDKKESAKSACLGLAILHKCGNNLKLPGYRDGLSGIVAQGLLKKWFEKCRQLWIQCGPQWDGTLFSLSEEFFDALTVVHESCKEGTYKVTESFLYPVGQLAVDPRIYILIQREAIRKFNLILDKIPAELKKKKKILTSQEASDIMIKMAGQILDGGDYDLQTAVMEALCRMAAPDQRKELADKWFTMKHVATAFTKICDSEFETDCRKFLNLVNGMQGDRRRVCSYPCLEVHLDKNELLMPADEKLEEFWIDFNLGSHSISFYFSLPDEEAQDGQWETICINEHEVHSYTVTEEGTMKILQLKLTEVVVVGAVEGSSLTIHFSSSLDILQAARRVYGHRKDKGFVGKTGTSVVKTTVKIMMVENNSQVVPESQVSLGESEKTTAPYPLPAPSARVQTVTPAKMRISESTTFISSSAAGSVRGSSALSAVMPANTPAKTKGKPSLQMVRSCDRKSEFSTGKLRTTAKPCSHDTTPNSTIAGGMIEQSDASLQSKASKQANEDKVDKHKKNIPVVKAVDMILSGQGEEQSLEHNFVPDTQPTTKQNTWTKLSVSEMLMMPTQKINSLPRPEPNSGVSQHRDRQSSAQRLSTPIHGPLSQKQLHTELTQRLQQVLSERNQDPALEEPNAPQRKMSAVREDSKGRSSANRSAPKEQKAQRSDLAKGKSIGQMPLEVDAAQIKAPAKASTTKGLQERKAANVMVETNRALSSKEKRDAEVAGGMVKLISSRYESTAKDTTEKIPQSSSFANSRPSFNMSWLPSVKKDVFGAVTSHNKSATCSTSHGKDIFAFNIDSQLDCISGKDKTFTNSSAVSSGGINKSGLGTTKKGQPVAKEKRHVKKHLFSDTDTDNGMTEVSWLRESGRKPKPKVTKYPRQAPVKPKAVSPHTSYESPDLPPPSPKPVKGNTKPNKKTAERVEHPKKTVKPAAAPNRRHAAGRRPQRAAAACAKSYKEPDTDYSQSESDEPPVSKYSSTDHLENAEKMGEAAQVTKKSTASKRLTKSYMTNLHSGHSASVPEQPTTSKQGKNERTCSEVPEVKKKKNRLNNSDQSDLEKPSGLKQQRPANVPPETSKLNKRNVHAPVQEQMNALKDSWTARQTSLCQSPPYTERMRSAERSAPTLGLTFFPLLTPRGSPLPTSPDPACQGSPSPILLLPKPQPTVSSKGNFKPSSLYSVEKKHSSSKTLSIQSVNSTPSLTPIRQTSIGPSVVETSLTQQFSPPRSPLALSTLPLMTSTLLELEKPPIPSPPQSPLLEDTTHNYGCNFDFSKVSSVSLPSTKSSVFSCRVKDTPAEVLDVEAEKSPPSDRRRKPLQLHVSGPTHKRRISSSSDSEEDEKEEKKKSKMRGQRSPRMKPRKLFKSFTKSREVSRVMSSSRTMSSRHWETEVENGDLDIDEDLELPKSAANPSNLCQQFSSELKKKFQKRYQMMEVYNKHSLKTVQQHVSSLNVEVTRYRTQRLEQVQGVLLEEIHKLEQDDTVLKNMEKDLTMYWKKQITAFHSYQDRENIRNGTLTKALQNNVCHSVEYEEKIFTNQMCLIRKDMKSVQDRLLSQMQEGEIQSVKRGLHALFFP